MDSLGGHHPIARGDELITLLQWQPVAESAVLTGLPSNKDGAYDIERGKTRQQPLAHGARIVPGIPHRRAYPSLNGHLCGVIATTEEEYNNPERGGEIRRTTILCLAFSEFTFKLHVRSRPTDKFNLRSALKAGAPWNFDYTDCSRNLEGVYRLGSSLKFNNG